MSQLGGIIVRNLAQFQRELDAEDQKRVKAARNAVRIEGFRLKKVMSLEIRHGAPGGKKFSPLSDIASRGGTRKAPPLHRLAIPVRYWAALADGRFSAHVGFYDVAVVDSHGVVSAKNQLSRSWINIAKANIEGRTFPAGKFNKSESIYSDYWNARTFIVSRAFGGRKGKKTLKPGFEKFLLRKSTTRLRIPSRPIIEPFWESHQGQASRNILNNFERKMNGERI